MPRRGPLDPIDRRKHTLPGQRAPIGRNFINRPVEERREIMRRQAEELREHYEDTLYSGDVHSGDIFEYEE